jgi:hypothetical protein
MFITKEVILFVCVGGRGAGFRSSARNMNAPVFVAGRTCLKCRRVRNDNVSVMP